MPKNFNNDKDQLYLKLAKILFATVEQNNGESSSSLEYDLPTLRLHYMIDDYEELSGHEYSPTDMFVATSSVPV